MDTPQDHLIDARSALTRRVLVALAVGGAVFGVLFGVLGMMVFVSGVVRRIDRLREDAGHLARGDALGPPHDASDELGELTQSIHEADRLLRGRDQEVREHVRALADANRELERREQEIQLLERPPTHQRERSVRMLLQALERRP